MRNCFHGWLIYPKEKIEGSPGWIKKWLCEGEQTDTQSLWCPLFFFFFCSVSALESKLVSQFCEDENGALIYNRVTNGYGNGYNSNNGNRNGNYAVGGYGYRPVTKQHILGDGQISINRGQPETTQHGSQGSSSTHVENLSAISQYFEKEMLSATCLMIDFSFRKEATMFTQTQ